jgi:hypothetical protein
VLVAPSFCEARLNSCKSSQLNERVSGKIVGMLVGFGGASVRFRAKNVSMRRKDSNIVDVADSQ